MASIPKKIIERIVSGLKKFQPLLLSAKSRDVGEADTVTIIKDMLSEIFGYDKYSEVTSEYAIRGTYCDLAIKLNGKLEILLEVKAIGIELKDNHVKQAIDYAANEGIDFVILTNGIIWQVYKVHFTKPIDKELIVDLDLTNINSRNASHLDKVFLLCKEGWLRSALTNYHVHQQALSRFFIGAVLQSESTLEVIRKELRRVTPDAKIDIEQIKTVLLNEVIKRDVLEGDKAVEATKKIAKASSRLLRASIKPKTSNEVALPTTTEHKQD
jgi:hypothetical protein